MANIAKSGSILGLESIQNLMKELSNMYGQTDVMIQDQLPIIHIAGTNGKGSVGTYLQSMLLCSGKTVGRYCSPAVFSAFEVWQRNGENISEDVYVHLVSQVKKACEQLVEKGCTHPTIFEVETAMAFLYFYENPVDYVLLECGMGGETDATNLILHPLASVFTTISKDHMQFLGDTLHEIAQVKSKIIKQECNAFSAYQVTEVERVLREEAKAKKSKISFVDAEELILLEDKPGKLEFSYRRNTYVTKMAGVYQMYNAALAIDVLRGIEPMCPQETIEKGIWNAEWPGRFEVVSESPLFILDGAHNEDAARRLRETIENCFTNQKIVYIIGVLADKEHEKMLEQLLPYAKRVYVVTPDNPRALMDVLLANEATKLGADVRCLGSLRETLLAAFAEDVPVVAFGSLSYLKDLKTCYQVLLKEGLLYD